MKKKNHVTRNKNVKHDDDSDLQGRDSPWNTKTTGKQQSKQHMEKQQNLFLFVLSYLFFKPGPPWLIFVGPASQPAR